ncbi:MAG: uncharacterized membrane protein YbhN (UPF0104 family) [Gammaproteobacteria bacterium]|jgi:uncharacterized membrane protein YbhN (UPF0104 family)
MSKDSPKPKSLAARFLKVLLAVSIIALVVNLLPWSDTISWESEAGDSFTISGTIEGDWKTDRVQFTMDPKAAAEAGDLPAWALTAADSGHLMDLSRDGNLVDTAPSAEPGALSVVGVKAEWDPGMFTVFASADLGYIGLAMVLFFLAMLFAVTRWWRLLGLVGCKTTWRNTLRLTYLGLFFNLVMPGLTGGDVAKAVIVVREHPERRGNALMSVIVDRVIGLMTLALLALVVVLIVGEPFGFMQMPLIVFAVAGGGGALAYFNKPIRRAIGFDKLMDKLPLGDKLKALDEAANTYFSHPVELGIAMLLSLGNHIVAIVAVWVLGLSFGVLPSEVALFDYFAIVPVANIVSSIPVMPMGFGVGDIAYLKIFEKIGASGALGTAVSITFRLCQLLLSLLGGLFLLAPGARVKLDDLEAEVAETEKVGA